MAVFRVEKNKGYTVMSNYHLRDKELSLKAKGLLSQMLSLPEDWDYTLQGLACINREKVDAIREAVKELERRGYISRSRERNEKGHLLGTEYIIREQPLCPVLDLLTLENPMLDNPVLENPMQLNKEEQSTEVSNTYQSIQKEMDGNDRMDCLTAYEAYREVIKDNIEYDALCMAHDAERTSEILELMLDTVCCAKKYIRVGGDDVPAEVVKGRFMKLGQFHIEYVMDCISKNTSEIRNIKSYLLTALYNAPVTISHYYSAEVQRDMGR